jgi:hypothetical protein
VTTNATTAAPARTRPSATPAPTAPTAAPCDGPAVEGGPTALRLVAARAAAACAAPRHRMGVDL